MNIITGSQIYWLTRCDSIRGFFDSLSDLWGLCIPLFIVGLILFTVGTFAGNGSYDLYSGKSDEDTEAAKRTLRGYAKRLALLGVAAGAFSIMCHAVYSFIPTTKETAAIIVIPRVANSESVQNVGAEIVDLAKEWMKELRPAKVKETAKAVKGAVDGTVDKLKEAVE